MPAATPAHRVLVIEDDERTARWLVLYLERDGLDVSVAGAATDARSRQRRRRSCCST